MNEFETGNIVEMIMEDTQAAIGMVDDLQVDMDEWQSKVDEIVDMYIGEGLLEPGTELTCRISEDDPYIMEIEIKR